MAADEAENPDVGATGEVVAERQDVEDATEQLLADTPAASEPATTTRGRSMAKKTKGAKKKSAPKKAGAAKATRQPRSKVEPSGAITGVKAGGTTYLILELEQGAITLTPTGNREKNRDAAVKAIKALLK